MIIQTPKGNGDMEFLYFRCEIEEQKDALYYPNIKSLRVLKRSRYKYIEK